MLTNSYDLNYLPSVLVALIPLIITLGIFSYLFFTKPHRKLNIAFSLFLVCLCLYQATDAITRLSIDRETASHWYRILTPSVNFLTPFALHFTLLFTRQARWINHPWVLFSIYAPAVIFAIAQSGGYIAYEMHSSNFWRWIFTPAEDLFTIINNAWIAISAWFVMYLLIRFVYKTRNSATLNKQAKLVAIGFSIPAFQGVITEILFPYVLNVEPVPATSLSMLAFSICLMIGLNKYELLSYSPRHSWHNIMRSMNEGVLIVDNDDVIRFSNPRFCEMTGYTEHELIGKSARLLFLSENDKHKADAAIKRRQQRKSDKYEIKLITKSGQTIIGEVSGSPYIDQHGKVVGSVGIMTDITEKKKSKIVQEIALEISQAMLTESRDFSDFSRLVRNAIKPVMNADNFYIALHDKENNELQFPLLIDKYNDKDQTTYSRKFENGITEHIIKQGKSMLLIKPDLQHMQNAGVINFYGTEPDCWLGVPLKLGNDVIGAMVVQSYDNCMEYTIADVVFMEQIAVHVARGVEKLKTDQRLKENEHLLRTYVEESLLPIYIFGADTGIILQANKAFFQLTGYSPKDIGLLTTYDLGNITEKEIKSRIATHKMGAKTTVAERQWQTAEGNKLDMLISVNYIEQGKRPLMFVTGLNITERKRHETELLAKHRETLQYQSMLLSTQINPHFIFNALNSVQYYVLNQNVEPALNFISEFSQLMRNVLNNSMRTEILLSEEIKFLELYLKLEQRRFNNKFTYEIEIDGDIDPDDLCIPPMLLQPYLENTVIHGIGNLEQNGRIKILFKQDGGYVTCTIEDNGVGREKAQRLKILKSGSNTTKSVAMNLTSERLRVLNGLSKERYSVGVLDMKNDDGLATGTRIEVKFPK